MSTILEALERSEKERQSNEIPTLGSMPVVDESRPVRWMLLIGLGVLAAFMLLVAAMMLVSYQGQVQGLAGANNAAAPVLPSVSVVSYSQNPEQRFVMVNDKLLREGDSLDSFTQVVSISRDSVELSIDGQRVTLKP